MKLFSSISNYFYKSSRYLALSAVFILAVSCDDDDDSSDPSLNVPTEYISPNYDQNAETEKTVREGLINLTDRMNDARDASVTLTATELINLYSGIRGVSTDYYADRVDGYLEELAKASGNMYNSAGTPSENGEGGVLGAYLFDENGMELEQLVEKGSYAAILYNHALAVLDDLHDNPNPATVDKIVEIWGAADLSFPNNGSDVLAARYAARRDQADGNGFYTKTRDALLKAQAAAANPDYHDELDAAIDEIKENWERAQMATVINYCQSAISKLTATDLDDVARGSALHSYSEGVGFLHGWKTISEKVITDAKIDELLVLMLAPAGEPAQSYRLLTETVTVLPQLEQVIDELQSIYNFTDAEIESFKSNWVVQQGR